MKNINYISKLTRMLTQKRIFESDPLVVIDVGARSGPQSHWPLYENDIRVIGFEPHEEECTRLNQIADQFYVPFVCYPVALGTENTQSRLYEYGNKAANSMTPQKGENEHSSHTIISVRRFEDFAKENNIPYVDFIKIDVERHEMDVIRGMGSYLNNRILGFELEVHFVPEGDTPMFSEIELEMRKSNYLIADLDIFKSSLPALPSPVAWDHRDHNNQFILGPTVQGNMVHGDALFFIDYENLQNQIPQEKNPIRILKMVSLFEVYGFPDRAAHMLIQFRDLLEPLISVDDALNALVPDYFGAGLSYNEYLNAYQTNVGRPIKQDPIQSRLNSLRKVTIKQRLKEFIFS